MRHVLKNGDSYEERITTWEADGFDNALTLARAEAEKYAAEVLHDGMLLDFFQIYHCAEPPSHGKEVFSLIRESDLSPDSYLETFFTTGGESQDEM